MPIQSPTYRSGMVAIVGRPNVGKSTLLNAVLKRKVAIVSKVPQTTRNQIRGIYHDERGQIVFIDTPGVHLGHDHLDKFMNRSSTDMLDDVDCIVYCVDASRGIGEEENFIAGKLKTTKTPVIMALNKMDLKRADIAQYISFWEEVKGKPVTKMKNFTMITVSAAEGKKINELIDLIFESLPEGPPLYPEDTVTDIPQRLAVADIIREKLFNILREEIPHSVGVQVETIQPRRRKTVYIEAFIVVERDTQKQIVIGKNGQLVKKVGTLAREELEKLLDSRIFLELKVKTRKNWRDNIHVLSEMGYRL